MLYDNLENINQYVGLFEHLDTAINFIEEHDLNELPEGRTEIDGENVFVNVSRPEAQPSEGRAFESHSRYMDLQIDLEGTELCEVALGAMTEAAPYDAEQDFALWNGDVSCAMVLGTGRFAVFMVEEAHKPCIKAEGSGPLKKAVFKIAY